MPTKKPHYSAPKKKKSSSDQLQKKAPRLTKNEGQTNQTNQPYLTKLKLTLLAASEFPPTKTSNNPGSATNFKSEL